MSHKGTLPVFSSRTNLENCLVATEKCDLFLGIITPRYGSGIGKDGLSITHHEMRRAISLKKPRWILAHDHVIFARTFLNNLGYEGEAARKKLSLKKNQVFDNIRLIDMYEEATISKKPLGERQGGWVHKFTTDPDAMLFASAQFSRYQEVKAFLQEHFGDNAGVSRKIQDMRDGHED